MADIRDIVLLDNMSLPQTPRRSPEAFENNNDSLSQGAMFSSC